MRNNFYSTAMDDVVYESDDDLPDPRIPETQDPDILSISSSETEEYCNPLPVGTVQTLSKSEPSGKDTVPESDSCSSDSEDMFLTPVKVHTDVGFDNAAVRTNNNSIFQGFGKESEVSKNNSNYSKSQEKQDSDISKQSNIPGPSYGKRQPFSYSGPNSKAHSNRNSTLVTESFSSANSKKRLNVERSFEYCDSSSDEGSNDSCSFFSQVSTILQNKKENDDVGKKETFPDPNKQTLTSIEYDRVKPSTSRDHTSPSHDLVQHGQTGISPVFSSKPWNTGKQRSLSSPASESSPMFSLGANSQASFQEENVRTVLKLLDETIESLSDVQKSTNEKTNFTNNSYDVEKNSALPSAVKVSEKSQVSNSFIVKKEVENGGDGNDESCANAVYHVTEDGSLYVFDSEDEEIFLSQMIQHGSLEFEDLSKRKSIPSEVNDGWDEDDDWLAGIDCIDEHDQILECNNRGAEIDKYLLTTQKDDVNDETEDESSEKLSSFQWQQQSESGFIKSKATFAEDVYVSDLDRTEKEVENSRLSHLQVGSEISDEDLFNQETQFMPMEADYEARMSSGNTTTTRKNKKSNEKDCIGYQSPTTNDSYSIPTQIVTSELNNNDLLSMQRLAIEDLHDSDFSSNKIIPKSKGGNTERAVTCSSNDDDPYSIPTQSVVYNSDDHDPFGAQTLVSEQPQDVGITGNKNGQKCVHKLRNYNQENADNENNRHASTAESIGQETQKAVSHDSYENDPYFQQTQGVDGQSTTVVEPYLRATQVIDNHDSYNSYLLKDDNAKKKGKKQNVAKISQNYRGIHPPTIKDYSATSNDSYDDNASSADEDTDDITYKEIEDSSGFKAKYVFKNYGTTFKNNVNDRIQNTVHQRLMQHNDIASNCKTDRNQDCKTFNSNHLIEDLDDEYDQQTQVIVSENSKSQRTNKDDDFCLSLTQTVKSDHILQGEILYQPPKYAIWDDKIESFEVSCEEGSDDVYNCQTQIVNREQKRSQHEENINEKKFFLKTLDVEDGDSDVYNQQTQVFHSEQKMTNKESEQQSKCGNINNHNIGNLNNQNINVCDDEDDIYGQTTQIIHNAATCSFNNDVKVSCDTKKLPKVSEIQDLCFRDLKRNFKNVFGEFISKSLEEKKATCSHSSKQETLGVKAQDVNISDDLNDASIIGHKVKQSSIIESFRPNKNTSNVTSNKSDSLAFNKFNKLMTENKSKRNLFEALDEQKMITQNDPSLQPPVLMEDLSTEMPQRNGEKKVKEKSVIVNKRTKSIAQSDSEGNEKKRQKTDKDKSKGVSVNSSIKSKFVVKSGKRRYFSESGKKHDRGHSTKQKRRLKSSVADDRLTSHIEAAKYAMQRRCHSEKGKVADGEMKRNSAKDSNHIFEDAAMPSVEEIKTLGLPIMNDILPVNKNLLEKGLPGRKPHKTDNDLQASESIMNGTGGKDADTGQKVDTYVHPLFIKLSISKEDQFDETLKQQGSAKHLVHRCESVKHTQKPTHTENSDGFAHKQHETVKHSVNQVYSDKAPKRDGSSKYSAHKPDKSVAHTHNHAYSDTSSKQDGSAKSLIHESGKQPHKRAYSDKYDGSVNQTHKQARSDKHDGSVKQTHKQARSDKHDGSVKQTHKQARSDKHDGSVKQSHKQARLDKHDGSVKETHKQARSDKHDGSVKETHKQARSDKHDGSVKQTHKQARSDKHDGSVKQTHKQARSDKHDGSVKQTHKQARSDKHGSLKQTHKPARSDKHGSVKQTDKQARSDKHDVSVKQTHEEAHSDKDDDSVKQAHEQAHSDKHDGSAIQEQNESVKHKYNKFNYDSKQDFFEKHPSHKQNKVISLHAHESVKSFANADDISVKPCAHPETQGDKLTVQEQDESLNSSAQNQDEWVQSSAQEKNETVKPCNHTEFSAGEEDDCAAAQSGRDHTIQPFQTSKPAEPQRQKDIIFSVFQGSITHTDAKTVTQPLSNSNKHHLTTSFASKKNLMLKQSPVALPDASHVPSISPDLVTPHGSILKRTRESSATCTLSANIETSSSKDGNSYVLVKKDKRVFFNEEQNCVRTFNTQKNLLDHFTAFNQRHQSAQKKMPSNLKTIGNFKVEMIQSVLKWNPEWLQEQGNYIATSFGAPFCQIRNMVWCSSYNVKLQNAVIFSAVG